MRRLISATLAASLAMLLSMSAYASERGKVTNLPIPRFVSLKAEEEDMSRKVRVLDGKRGALEQVRPTPIAHLPDDYDTRPSHSRTSP